MVSAGKRLRAIVHLSAKCCLHGDEVVFDVAVVVDEIFDAKIHAITIAENDADPFRHPLPGDGSKHFGVTTELNRVVGLGRKRQLRVPNLILG